MSAYISRMREMARKERAEARALAKAERRRQRREQATELPELVVCNPTRAAVETQQQIAGSRARERSDRHHGAGRDQPAPRGC